MVWKDWEIQIIKQNFSKGGAEACNLPTRTKQAIVHKAHRMGIYLNYEEYCKRHAVGPRNHSDETKRKMSEVGKGRPKSESFKLLMSERMTGDKHPNWQGGKSFEEYDKDFNPQTKRKILKRDNFMCMICRTTVGTRRLVVHHIDHNKLNSTPSNLVTLCITCHNKHHTNPEYETEFFKELLQPQDMDLISSNTYLAIA